MWVSCLVVTSRRSRDQKQDFQLQTTQMLEASCLFSFKSILLRTSWKCQSIKRTACMLNFIYIVQSKWYLRLKISVQGPFNTSALIKLGPLPSPVRLSVQGQWAGECSVLSVSHRNVTTQSVAEHEVKGTDLLHGATVQQFLLYMTRNQQHLASFHRTDTTRWSLNSYRVCYSRTATQQGVS